MMIRRLGGFRLGRRLVRIWRWVLRRPHKRCYLRLRLRSKSQSVTKKLLTWGRSLSRKLRCKSGGGGGNGDDYYRIGDQIHELPLLGKEEVIEAKPPPKGHLAVYVGGGRKDGGPPRRYLVPVVYFNHPLFGELLREAEAEFGFHHPGGITIPCPVSRFERVQTRIKAAEPGSDGKSSSPRLYC